jgi:hypothetical protein
MSEKIAWRDSKRNMLEEVHTEKTAWRNWMDVVL